jgi:hypothetical protein
LRLADQFLHGRKPIRLAPRSIGRAPLGRRPDAADRVMAATVCEFVGVTDLHDFYRLLPSSRFEVTNGVTGA